MKKILVITVISLWVCFSAFAQEKSMKLTLNLKNSFIPMDATLFTSSLKETFFFNDNKEGSVVVPLKYPEYVILQVGVGKTRLYLEPGKDLSLTLLANEDGSISYTTNKFAYEGPNAAINRYLSSDKLMKVADADFLLDEKAYLAKLAKVFKANQKMIQKQKFPKDFEQRELMRVKYLVYEPLARYPIQHFWKEGRLFSGLEQYEPTPEVMAFMPSLFIDSEEAWDVYSYREFLEEAVGILALKDGLMSPNKNKDIIDRLEYLCEHFKSPKILEEITHSSTMRYLEETEGKPLGEIETYYKRLVKSEKYHKQLTDALAMWAKMGKGSEVQSNTYKYQDIDGKMVALEDLKGKYVYIDVWATWCGPCCAEIPHLKTLEQKFKGKNILFVSISVDSNKAAWMKKVKNDQLGGIQLHGGAEAQIMKDYKIKGIPRFILLDREGKVIDNDMTRPSDPATTKTIEALEGI